jgi:hypothetical protein
MARGGMIGRNLNVSALGPQIGDEFEIRRLLENWVIWRDSGDFVRFASLWHPQGRMVATWLQASASDFIARSRVGFERGAKAIHFLGGSIIEVSGTRAIAQSKMTIMARGPVHGIEVDVACHGRFFDFMEKVDGCWLLWLRQPIYELDRMTPIEPARGVELDRALLSSFPRATVIWPTYRPSRYGGEPKPPRDPRTRGRGPLRARARVVGGRWCIRSGLTPRRACWTTVKKGAKVARGGDRPPDADASALTLICLQEGI